MKAIEVIDHRTEVYAIFDVGGQLIINDGTKLSTRESSLLIELPNSYRFNNGLITTISSGRADIYDKNLSLLRTISDKRISPENTAVEAFTCNDFGLFRFTDTNELEVYRDGKKAGVTKDFWGKLLSPTVRLNFKPGTFDNPTYFRGSDLTDEKTFFEFECIPGQEIVPHFVLRDDQLLFPLVEGTKVQFIKLDVQSGEILWKGDAGNATFNYDESQSKLVSFWATKNTHGKSRYQIIDLITSEIIVGDSSKLSIVKNIHTPQHLRYLYGNHMYFADNRHSFEGKEIDPVRFGRMDLISKEIEFVQEISGSPTSQIVEIVEHHDHVYIRNQNNELYIYRAINT